MIYGERVRLRAIERADVASFYTWVNDPEVTAGLSLYLPLSQAAEEKWFEDSLTRPPVERPLAIEARSAAAADDWRLIGNCGFHEVDWKSRSAELGIMIGEKGEWNRGYGTDVMRLLLRHGFANMNLNRVWLRVLSPNLRAIRCYEKAGFCHEGRMRQAEYKNGEYVDMLIMSVLHSEWHPAGE